MGAGCIAQLMAAWAIGGSPSEMGWAWTKFITIYMCWPIPLQDLRDVPGDLAQGRRTTPILMGDIPCKPPLPKQEIHLTSNTSSYLYLGRHLRLTSKSSQDQIRSRVNLKRGSLIGLLSSIFL
jgi:hypothetical protein